MRTIEVVWKKAAADASARQCHPRKALFVNPDDFSRFCAVSTRFWPRCPCSPANAPIKIVAGQPAF
jgi:hypothetical protein